MKVKQPKVGDKVWQQIEGERGKNGIVLRTLGYSDDKEYLVSFYEQGRGIFSQEGVEDWIWYDNLGGYWRINKERNYGETAG